MPHWLIYSFAAPIGTASTKEGQELVLREGAHAVFNHRDEDYLQRIKDSTRDGAGVDLVIEMLANVNLAKDLDVIKRGGSVVIVGSRGELNFAPRYVLNMHRYVVGIFFLFFLHCIVYAGSSWRRRRS